MGTYRRRGHWRRGRDGTRHWVSEHSVTRSGSGWDRSPSYTPRTRRERSASRSVTPRSTPSPRRTWEPLAPRNLRPYSNRWAKPNARCPVCGAEVYFYANAQGSRVYFDEMGPPWPKHPCMVSLFPRAPGRGGLQGPESPMTYQFRDGRQQAASGDLFTRRYRSDDSFRERYGVHPSEGWIVLGTWPLNDGTMLHLHRAYQWDPPVAWWTSARVNLSVGTLVFIKGKMLTFIAPESLEVVTAEVRLSHRLPRPPLLARIRAHLKGRPIL